MDEELQLLRAGDPDAFTRFYNEYIEYTKAIAHRHLRVQGDIDEIANDAMIRAHRGIAKFRGDSSLKTWLTQITLNLARNRWWYNQRRRQDRTYSLDQPIIEGGALEFHEVIPSNLPSPRDKVEFDEVEMLSTATMSQLEPYQQRILEMRGILHMPYDQIAAELGINIGTVKSRLARARVALEVKMRAAA